MSVVVAVAVGTTAVDEVEADADGDEATIEGVDAVTCGTGPSAGTSRLDDCPSVLVTRVDHAEAMRGYTFLKGDRLRAP